MNEKQLREFVRSILIEDGKKLRFDMSGYDASFDTEGDYSKYEGNRIKGECYLHNQSIINKFARFGLFDTTHYLFLDFYKGTPTVYYRIWGNDRDEELELGGYSTTDICTILVEKFILDESLPRRRRS